MIYNIIANIPGQEGLNLYYNPFLSQNRYLAGLDYGLTGGGWLKAVRPVLEAPTLLLLAGGLLAIGGVSRRLRAR